MDVISLIPEKAVLTRRSVRTFDGRPLTAEDAVRIAEAAENAVNPFGIDIKWHLLDASAEKLGSPVIKGEGTYITGTLPLSECSAMALGYSMEEVLLFAWSIGVGSTWIAGTMDRKAFEKASCLGQGEIMPCISPLGYPSDRMSAVEVLMRKGAGSDSRNGFSRLFFDGSFDTPLDREKAGPVGMALELVRLAPSAVNRQPWRAVVCGSKVHFYLKRHSARPDRSGWNVQDVDMGIALCHFAIGAELYGLEARFCVDDPGINAPADTAYRASFEVKQL